MIYVLAVLAVLFDFGPLEPPPGEQLDVRDVELLAQARYNKEIKQWRAARKATLAPKMVEAKESKLPPQPPVQQLTATAYPSTPPTETWYQWPDGSLSTIPPPATTYYFQPSQSYVAPTYSAAQDCST